MNERPPVERHITPYWRDPRCIRGCVSRMPNVARIPASQENPPQELQLLETILELGASIPDEPAALEAIARAFDAVGDQRASETLALIFARLPRTKEGSKLRQALLGTLGSGPSEAKRNGTCKQSWFKSITRLKERIYGDGG